MKLVSRIVLIAAAGGLLASSAANAQHPWHRHSRPGVGVYIGGPLWWGHPYAYPAYPAYPYSYYPPPYYYPPTVIQSSPPVYIEQSQQQPAPAAAPSSQAPVAPTPGYWYYCRDPQGYYPYVKECPTPWERVAPQPAK